MKNTFFMLVAAFTISVLVLVAATLIYLSKTSEYSRTSDEPIGNSQPEKP